ncbi:hypothetical protein PUNSTDRAFT_140778, partial [Punctularia strigosozonata HHB-11173 SS5]|uniref:uncharacterized protein n=1 Tax=Punctularia strigosozonata (strain HHB-11173) TaxID=741275 RepID=UPI00044186CA
MSGRHDPPRSPLFGTATFSTLSPSDTYDYDSRSSTPRPSAQANTEQNGRYSRRSPPEYDDDSDDASFADQAEVEAALNMIDNELNNAEDVVTAWSTPRAEGVLPERDRRHLSTITERTEGSSRPLSGGHSRYATDPGATPTPERVLAIPRSHTPDRGIVRAHTPGRRVGELAAFYEERSTTPGHRRTPSAPAGPRSPSPYAGTSTGYGYGTTTGYDNSTGLTGLTSSRYTATGYGTTTGYSTSGYGGSSGYSSPTKSRSTISSGSSGYDPTTLSSLLSPPLRTDTPTNTRTDNTRTTETYTSNTFTTFSGTNSTTATSSTATPTATGLRRPQTSPRSPLTSVRNIVAAWKQRTPSLGTGKGLKKDSPSPTRDEGLFSLRRRAERGEARLREEALQERRSGPSLREPAGRSEMASFGSAVIPPAFDISELGAYANARGSQEPLRIGLLWYLNVHGSEPYRWQRCQALLYPHMLLLSWIAPAGGRGVVTLDLLNCTEVRSVPSPLHPSARDDVGTIAARAQSGETTGQSGEMGLMEMLCPFQLLYSDGVERLGAESARERVRWVSAIWEALDRAVTIPDRSVSGSPTGSIRTIRSMASTASRQSGSQAASGSGSASTVFVPPTDTIPDLSDLQSISGSSTFSLTRRSSRAQHTRAADDGALSNQSFVYPGDPRVIGPSRSSSIRRTTSLTDLDREFATATSRGPGGPRAFGIARFGTRLPSTRTTTAEDDDEAFFSTGSRTSGTDSTFYSLPSATDVVSDAPSRTLKTEVSPSTLSFRRTASASYLGDSHSGSSSSRTRTSPSHGSSGSQTSLSRMQAVRRRAAGSSSRTFTTTYLGSDETSDKENSGSYTASDSRSTGASDEYSSGYDRSSSGRDLSMSTLESYSSYSGTYSSTYSDSYTGSNTRTTSSGGPPSYPSSSAPSEPGAQDPGQPPSTPSGSYSSAPSIPSLDEYATAEKASTVFSEGDRASTIYSIAEKASTEFSVAEAASTTYSTVERAPTEYGSIPSELPLDEVDRESVKLPTEVPTIPSSPASVHPENIPLPPSVSPSIASVSPPAVVPPSPTEPVSTSLLSTESSPTESSVSPSPVRSPTELTPTPSTPSVLEPSLPSPSIRESMWAPETDESYESSFLGASPSVQSIAVPEGLDASIETSFLRPSPSPVTPGTRLSTVPETISVSAASSPMPPSPPSLSPTPSSPSTITPTASPLTMTVSSVTPTQSTRSPTVSSLTPTVPSLTPTVSSPSLPPLPSPSPATFTSLLRTPSTLSTASSISMRSSVLYPKSLLDVPLEDVPTEPSLLSTGSSRSSPRLPLPEDIPLPSSPAASLVP